MINFENINSQLLPRLGELVVEWLPGGKLKGNEYCCGSLQGDKGDSCRINVVKGVWKDFATGDGGSDPISLFAAINGLSQIDSAKQLLERYNLNPYVMKLTQPVSKPEPAPIITHDIPDELPDFTHYKNGSPSDVWTYRSLDGKPWFYIARYNVEGRKEFAPWTYDSNEKRWVSKALPAPRPLYGLELLSARPDASILLVEGEKSADAARKFSGPYIVVSWPGGSNGINQVDFTPIHGRRVLLWPDADRQRVTTPAQSNRYSLMVGDLLPKEGQPGYKAMQEIAKKLVGHCPDIKILEIEDDPERPAGWDAADSQFETWSSFREWAAPRAKLFQESRALETVTPEIVERVSEPPTIRVEVGEADVRTPASVMVFYQQCGIALTTAGLPLVNIDNVARLLMGSDFKPQIWFDEFHKKYFTNWETGRTREWSDKDDLAITVSLQRNFGFHKFPAHIISTGVRAFADRQIRNEPKDWMDSLVWDQVPRISRFFPLAMGSPENEYSAAVSSNFWVSMAARIYQPGSKVDNMVILEGDQGKYKSTALDVIGGHWFAELTDEIGTKDFYQSIQGKLIVEFGELDSLGRADVTKIKKVLSCRSDRFRPPYGHAPVDFPRQCVFVGTTNEETYLKDHTGARRFWPIKTHDIHIEYIRENREQLFAEAVHKFKAGETWWTVPGESKNEQELRRESDAWEDIIAAYLELKSEVTLQGIAINALEMDTARFDMVTQKRLSRIMKVLGWHRISTCRGNIRVKIWVRASS